MKNGQDAALHGAEGKGRTPYLGLCEVTYSNCPLSLILLTSKITDQEKHP